MRDPRRFLFESEDPSGAVDQLVRSTQPPPSLADRLLGAAALPVRALGGLIATPFEALQAIPEQIRLGTKQAQLHTEALRQKNELGAIEVQEARSAQPMRQQYRDVYGQELAELNARLAEPPGEGVESKVDRILDRSRRDTILSRFAAGSYDPVGTSAEELRIASAPLEPVIAGQSARAKEAAQLAGLEAAAVSPAIRSGKRFESDLIAGRDAANDRRMLQNQKALKEFEQKLGPGPAKPSDVSALRGQYLQQSQDFLKYRDAAAGIEVAASNDSGAGDVALVYNFIKLMDPNAVKEGEYALTESASQTIPEVWRNNFNRLIGNKANRLSPAARAELLATARPLFEKRQSAHASLSEQFVGIAQRSGIRPEDVVVNLDQPQGKKRPPITPEQAAAELRRRRGR